MTTTAPPQTIRPGKSEGPQARYPTLLIRPPTPNTGSLPACTCGTRAYRGQGGSAATRTQCGSVLLLRIGPTPTRSARTHPIWEDGCFQETGVPFAVRQRPMVLLPVPTPGPLATGTRCRFLKAPPCFASLNGDLPRVVPNQRPVAPEALKMYRRAHQGDGL